MSNEVMTPTEFVLWLNGATSMLEGPPSAEQWTKMQENLHPIIAKMMAEKLMGNAEEVTRNKAHAAELEAARDRYDKDRQRLMDMLNKQLVVKGSWDPYVGRTTTAQDLGTVTTTSITPLNNIWLSNVPLG